MRFVLPTCACVLRSNLEQALPMHVAMDELVAWIGQGALSQLRCVACADSRTDSLVRMRLV